MRSGNIIVYKIKIMDLNKDIQRLVKELRYLMKENFNRHVSLQDLLTDRWETAEFYGLERAPLVITMF